MLTIIMVRGKYTLDKSLILINSGGYPKTTTYNTDEIYIPMKVFPFNTYIEIAEKARTDYG